MAISIYSIIDSIVSMAKNEMDYYDDAKLEELFGDVLATPKAKIYNLKAFGRTFPKMTKPEIESMMEDEFSSECPVSYKGDKVLVGGDVVGTLEAI
jgi:hypothetical protein